MAEKKKRLGHWQSWVLCGDKGRGIGDWTMRRKGTSNFSLRSVFELGLPLKTEHLLSIESIGCLCCFGNTWLSFLVGDGGAVRLLIVHLRIRLLLIWLITLLKILKLNLAVLSSSPQRREFFRFPLKHVCMYLIIEGLRWTVYRIGWRV